MPARHCLRVEKAACQRVKEGSWKIRTRKLENKMDTDKTEFLSKEDVILFVQADAAEKKRPFKFARRD